MEKQPYSVDPQSGSSHPVIRYESMPLVEGPLFKMNQKRVRIVRSIVRDSQLDFRDADLDWTLGEALYQEKVRIRKEAHWSLTYPFVYKRLKNDRRLFNEVQHGLLKRAAEADRRLLLGKVLRHYAAEIAGHFDPKVYRFATGAVPWLFRWFLNAASVKSLLPWGMTESLEDRIKIVGEVPMIQQLAKRGTILLVPTHQSNIDSILIGYVIYLMGLPPFAYGAGLNLFTNPVLNFFMGSLGAYTVDRQKKNTLYKTILKNYSTRILREGVHSIFFPGGGRSRSGAIESNLKLGLLGTTLEAQINNLSKNRPNPGVFIVPMVTSFHFVLEASSLIEQYLSDIGRHRFLRTEINEPPPFFKAMQFFWKLFSSKTEITVRIGRPLDVFGNLVDPEGRSLGPNSTTIDPRQWLTTRGELKPEPQRDREYTRELGERIVERYYRDNTVVSSHMVAFAYFRALRRKYRDLDLYRFLRLSEAQRMLQYGDFIKEVQILREQVLELFHRGELYLAEDVCDPDIERWVQAGIRHLGLFHGRTILKVEQQAIWTEDLSTLYYYRNRLSGYGLTLLAMHGKPKMLRGETDEQGFLA